MSTNLQVSRKINVAGCIKSMLGVSILSFGLIPGFTFASILAKGGDPLKSNQPGSLLPLDIGDTIKMNLGPMIAYYPFNHDVNDYSGNGLHATLNGADPDPATPCASLDSSYRFLGNGDNIAVPHSSLYNSYPISFSCWIRKNTNSILLSPGGTTCEGIIWKSPNTGANSSFVCDLINQYPPFKISIGIGNGTTMVGASTQNNIYPYIWYHLAGVFRSNSMVLFINGQAVDSLTFSPAAVTNTSPIYIGMIPNGTTPYPYRFLFGNIDDLRFYGRALTYCEVKSLYASCNPLILNVSYIPEINPGDVANIKVQNPEPGISYQLLDAQTLSPAAGTQTSNMCNANLDLASLSGLGVGEHRYKVHAVNTTSLTDRILDTTIVIKVISRISGHVKYLNASATPVDVTRIKLKDQNHQVIDSTFTDISGYYSFTVPSTGTYYIEPAIDKIPGGFNAMDALKALRHFVHLDTLLGLYFKAGDVNSSTAINSVDAKLIMNRFGGLLGTFIIGDWVYDNNPVTITGPSQSHDINVLCAGDVNASYVPPPCLPLPTVANAGNDQLNLTGNNVSLLANTPLAGETGTWTLVSGNCGTFGNIHDPHSLFSGMPGNSYTLSWRIQNHCTASSDSVNISFSGPFICGNNITYSGQTYHTIPVGCRCWMKENLNIGTMIAGTTNQTNNGIIEKYCYGGSINNCSTYGGLYQWNELMQYTNQSSRGICPDYFHIPSENEWCLLASSLDPTVNCNITGFIGTNAGGILKEMGTTHWSTPNLGAVNTSGFTSLPGGWRQEDGSFLNSTRDGYYATSSESNSSNQKYWSVDYIASAINHDVISKNYGFSVRCILDTCLFPPSQSSAGPDQNIIGTSTVLSANIPTYGYGHWSIISGSAGILNNAADPLTAFSGNYGSYVLVWTIATSCNYSADTVNINFNCVPQPTIAVAGADQVVNGPATILTGNAAVSGTGQWAIVSGTGGIIADPTSPVSGFTGNYTTYTLAWTISNSCGSTTDQVMITFNCYPPPSIAVAGPNQSIGGTATTLAANAPVNGTGAWSYISGPGGYVNDLSDPLSAFSGNYGTHVLQWTITTACGSSSSQVSITFSCVPQPTTANAGPNQSVNGTSTDLAANAPADGNGHWSIVSGTGANISDLTSPVSSFSGSYGTYVLAWTITTVCGSSSSQVTITFNCVPQPTPSNAGTNQNVSGTSTSLAGNIATSGTGLWTILSGTGGHMADSTSPTSAFTGSFGTYVLQWTISTLCGSSSSTVTIVFSAVPGSPCPGIATVDYSGKTYNTVQIGGQCWLKENLDVGTQISTSVAPTDNGIIEKNCYNNDPANCLVYGGLYRWDEAMQYTNIGGTQGICPVGWHIPTDADWCTLATYIDYIVVCTYNNNWQGLTVGSKMKEIGTSHWNSPNSGATNNSGFTALGSGDYNGSSMAFENFKTTSIFMSSSELNLNTAWSWILGTNYGSINRKSTIKTFSIPIRCIKD